MKLAGLASNAISRTAYGAVSASLMLISFVMIGTALWNLWAAAIEHHKLIRPLLNAISLIVIAMAVFDVSKFLIEEEVLGGGEKESPLEERGRLMRFLVIITIAISLEALVFIFNAARESMRSLIYPTLLLMADILLIVSLGVYYRLTYEVAPKAVK